MNVSEMKVAVIGAGIGGLAVANALAARGADVTVLEQAEEIREVGAGLQISPNGFRVARALGIGDVLSAKSVQAKAVRLRDYLGAEVARLDLGMIGSTDYYFTHRADLIEALATGAREAGVRLRLLQKVESVEPGEAPRVILGSGATLTADLVVGADGLHSVVRKALNGVTAPFFTRQIAWRAVIPGDVGGTSGEVAVFMGPYRHIVTYPLRGGSLRNVVAVQERAAWTAESWSQTDDPDTVRAAFSDFCPEVRDLLGRVEAVNLWGLFRHPVAARWHGDGVAILGDAAHPTLPFMAQGACMALEDAWILTDSLARCDDLSEALGRYQQRREGRARKIVATANANGWRYHLAFPPLRRAFQAGVRLAGTVAPRRLLGQFDWIYNYDAPNEV